MSVKTMVKLNRVNQSINCIAQNHHCMNDSVHTRGSCQLMDHRTNTPSVCHFNDGCLSDYSLLSAMISDHGSIYLHATPLFPHGVNTLAFLASLTPTLALTVSI